LRWTPQCAREHRIGACGDRPFSGTPTSEPPNPEVEFAATREKLHELVDEFSEDEAEAALARLVREREAIEQWVATADAEADEDAWARENAREAVREEPW
jgi:hypothetical protein